MTSTTLSQQSTYLSVLTLSPAAEVKNFIESLLPVFPATQVLGSRTGLAMLPCYDSVKGVEFHLGEVLLAEAHVQVGTQQGYAACLGRDLEQAIALAIVDAALQSNEPDSVAQHPTILDFVASQAQRQQASDDELLHKIEATRVELETF